MDLDLHLCNLVAQGVPMAKAKKIVAQAKKPSEAPAGAPGVEQPAPTDGDAEPSAPVGAPVDGEAKPAWMP